MATRKTSATGTVYQLKITLKGSRPPIWRRVQVLSSTTLGELHRIIQIAMGWTDSHLHQFTIHGEEYGEPQPEFDFYVQDEAKVKLSKVVTGEKFKFTYDYDFGDSWDHQILVEKVLPPAADGHYPVCLTGKRACPPEDCGGVWGYEEMLEAIKDPTHPEYENYQEWLPEDFDPEFFDLAEVNEALL